MPPIINTNIQYKWLVMEELRVLQEYKVIFEPVKIGTAAAILIAALLCNENETMLILPSDHFIGDLNNFYASVERASQLASKTNSIVTFGVKPHEFNSEYGYINAVYNHKEEYHIVKSFIEKPEHELSGDHYWNSGIFVFKAKRYVDEIKKSAPHLYGLCCANFARQERFLYLKQRDFAGIEGVSIDYLVMEKAENVAMIEANFDWLDIGTWHSVLELSKKEPVSFQRTTRKKEKPVWITGENFKIEEGNTKSRVSNKSLISFVNRVKKIEAIRKEVKPWGFCNVILMDENFLIKYLFINPLSCTSKQFHHYRDECHVVLSGVGYVSLDDKEYSVMTGHVVEIPREVSHRIKNRSASSPLEIVEFQIGELLSDSDIVRLDDVYGRF